MTTIETKMGDPNYTSDSTSKSNTTDTRGTTTANDGNSTRPGGSSGAYNPDSSFQGVSASRGSYAGTFVAESTHFAAMDGHVPVNYNAEAYNLTNLPRTADPNLFRVYAPSTWLQNSAPQQLEQLNSEMLHYNDTSYQSMFAVNSPSYIDIVANDPTRYRLFQNVAPSTGNNAGVHIPDETSSGHGGGLDLGKFNMGLVDAKLGYNASKGFYGALESEETAAGFGESIIEGAAGLAESVGLEAGTVGMAAEFVGGSVAIGATAATLGMVGAGLLLGYGAYEAATALGAPTISDDIKAFGGASKDVTNFFNGFL